MAAQSSSNINNKIKFHYGYGGKIVCGNRGKLRYAGGDNGILAVERGITYTELIIKLWDTWGSSMRVRCKLPGDDLDLLILVTSDEDLAYVIEEYDQYGKGSKIRVILDESPTYIIEEQKLKVEVDNFLGLKATQRPVVGFTVKDSTMQIQKIEGQSH